LVAGVCLAGLTTTTVSFVTAQNEVSKAENDAASADPSSVLHVYASPWNDGFHVVSKSAVDHAEKAHAGAAAKPYFETYGELRKAGEVDELSERLADNYDIGIELYVAAIERDAGRTASAQDVSARLVAVSDVDFDGAEDDAVGDIPADDVEFRSESERDDEVPDENVFMNIIASSTRDAVPADLFDQFCTETTPMFSSSKIQFVPSDRLEPFVAALGARGYTVVRDD
jgi:hypothetical protein